MDRRSFLGGSAAAGIAVSVPIAVGPVWARSEWGAAMQAYRAVRERHDVFAAKMHDPLVRAGQTVPRDIGDQMDKLGDELGFAEDRLMQMPAPDRAALRWKLDLVFADCGGSTGGWDINYLAQMFADYRRLLGDA